MRTTSKISEAHVNYLEHQLGRKLGSFTHEEIRGAVKLLLAGKLPKRKPDPRKFYTRGQAFICYNRPRQRVELDLTKREIEKIAKAAPTPMSRDARAPKLEFLIDEHAYPLSYYIDNHKCDKWCSAEGGDPCPGKVFQKRRVA